MSSFWMVRAGERGVLASEFEREGCVAVGWGAAGDLTSLDTADAIRARIEEAYSRDTPISRGLSTGQLHRFRNVMAPADRIVTFDGARREYIVGTIVGPYEYLPGVVADYPQVRRVTWEGRVPRDRLPVAALNTLGSLLTIFEPGPEVLAALDAAMRGDAPDSRPGPLASTGDPAHVARLFAQFEGEYLTTAAGTKHREAYARGRHTARENFAEIVRRADAGEDVTDLVLSKLLPHTDTQPHRDNGDWIHVAPAITKDIRSWYEGSGLAAPQDWPDRARLILAFVRRAVDRPAELSAACAEFAESPLARGFQAGMLTPVLSSLRPDDFALVNAKMCTWLAEVTGERASPTLVDYPQINARILAVVERHRDVFSRAALAGVSALEAFDMMSHWFATRADGNEDEDDDAVGPGRAAGGMDRTSADAARSLTERFCPDPAPRAVALQRFADSLRFAHASAPSSWSVTLRHYAVRLNVGGIFMVDLRRDGLHIVVNTDTIDAQGGRELSAFEGERFNYLESTTDFVVPYSRLDPVLALLRGAHEEAIRQVIAKTVKAPFKKAHSPGILEMLRAAGHDVPTPGWVAVPPASTNPTPPTPGPNPPPAPPALPTHPAFALDQAAEETHIAVGQLERWVAAVNRKGQAILYGPPGTGKTYVADRLRRHLLSGGNGHTDLVQFHPAYSYEDFIQGLRPRAGADGRLTYEMVPGRFVEFCEEAATRSGASVLVIDEINRANLSQVFGELMYLLEYRDRDLPLAGGRRLRIPPNVRIIGTMNTADRSIALVDHALRRRFAFLRLDPSVDVLTAYHERRGVDVSGLAGVLTELNATIADPHSAVGISFFLREQLAEHLEAIWEGEIEPYVEELLYDRRKDVERFRWSAVEARARPEILA